MTALEKRMVLHSFMCEQFGYNNLSKMLAHLKTLYNQMGVIQSSVFAQALSIHRPPLPAVVIAAHSHTRKHWHPEKLSQYDENIIAHSQCLNMAGERTWKPFQYLALLFTERYLDLYFSNREELIKELNTWKNRNPAYDVTDYTDDDLRTLAFQSATGSGKTLLLHANILQYQHYLEQHNQLQKLNKILLVTPNEGLSRQHLRELQASNITAQLFSDDSSIFSRGGTMVDIIDLHKLDEKKGIKRVALESFEENNLVLVDEGHLGVGGKVWRKHRKQLAKNGFTFEYSATFNQATSGGTEKKKLLNEYGKSILFDYSYKFFYEDGYGKDYKISNLQSSGDGEANNLYLLACLLTFYQQCRIYAEKSGQWRDFNLAPPLWVFLGKTVTGGKARKDMETDVVRIIKFLVWVHSNQQGVVKKIKQLFSNNTGLIDKDGADIFSESFPYIKQDAPEIIYDDVCTQIFHGKGQLHITHLTGNDELQLSTGDATPFGVINVGDSSGLYTKLDAMENPSFILNKNSFSKPLFDEVDDDGSPVTIVIGARRFVAGWNSWRVSTMGLMHVGQGEGPEIIQMFGRGVRLKGHGMSLQRHTAMDDVSADDSDLLKLLETLNIFGLKANYMNKFREYLQKESIGDRVAVSLPVKTQFDETAGLKILKKQDDAGEFQYSDMRVEFELAAVSEKQAVNAITIDRRKHLQVLESEQQTESATTQPEECKLEKKHLSLIDKQSVYRKVLKHKRRSQWHNMIISQETVNALLEPGNDKWYHLYISPEKLDFSHYGRVHEWESLAVDLLAEYAGRYWRKQRNKWEHNHMQTELLAEGHANYLGGKYNLYVDAEDMTLIEDIKCMIKEVEKGQYDEGMREFKSGKVKIELLKPGFHAYIPLLHAQLLHVIPNDAIHISPVSLNKGEADFVNYLKKVVASRPCIIQGKEIYLMRNLSRGKGISFFDDHGFYPDFILWAKDEKQQDILFIDPKGLVHNDKKVGEKIALHKRIKEDTEKKLRKDNPELRLHSYIWVTTRPEHIEMPPQDKGVYLASEENLVKLLEDALGEPDPA